MEVKDFSRGRRLRLITLTKTLIILDITKIESNIIVLLYIKRKKMEVMFLLASLTGSNTRRANLLRLSVTLSVLDIIIVNIIAKAMRVL